MHAKRNDKSRQLEALVEGLVQSYHAEKGMHHLDATFLPSRAKTIQIIELLRRLIFPGFFDEKRLTSAGVEAHVRELLHETREATYEQIRQALRYEANRGDDMKPGDTHAGYDDKAWELTDQFLTRLPEVRRILATDVRAAFDGDPAAVNTDETIFCYPGVDAIFIHRIAHEFYLMDVPMLPRIMSEYAHNETGIDIHPGATIDESFFIDHGTGVVLGETTVIGKRVKVYQGVTLGALSTKGGQAWRGRKRHPTIGDDVTIYGGAIILGGRTVIGKGAVIGGSVFLTQSVPAGHTVKMEPPRLSVSARPERTVRDKTGEGQGPVDAGPFGDYAI